jgi:hypothetical protein
MIWGLIVRRILEVSCPFVHSFAPTWDATVGGSEETRSSCVGKNVERQMREELERGSRFRLDFANSR